jgi:hypothetical protein
MERTNARLSARSRDPQVVRFTPERTDIHTRQNRILRTTEAIIEVPEEMYRRGGGMDFE